MFKLSAKQLARAASVAALYAALCFLLKPISFGYIQLRISEVLCILPIFMPEASFGLFIGCIISNLLGGGILLDICLGSLATFISALLTRKIHKKTKILALSLLPPVVLNALIVGSYLPFIYTSTTKTALPVFVYSVISVAIGEIISVYAIGLPFAKALIKTKFLTFR